jgi:hypothetical protein
MARIGSAEITSGLCPSSDHNARTTLEATPRTVGAGESAHFPKAPNAVRFRTVYWRQPILVNVAALALMLHDRDWFLLQVGTRFLFIAGASAIYGNPV